MSHTALREAVCQANRDLVRAGLVVLTWGNASGVDRAAGVMAIKPSGVAYDRLSPDDIVVVSLADGRTVAGSLKPSSDAPTHLHLYRRFASIGGIVHTHSTCATSWAQAAKSIPCLGTTHADHFHGPIPVARALRVDEISGSEYEHCTGVSITDRFEQAGLDPLAVPAVLVPGHAPFAWGPTVGAALENAIALEQIARMALHTLAIDPSTVPLGPALHDRHFLRKHGSGASYGQRGSP